VDFILAFPDRKIPIEIGHGKKEIDQVLSTLKKVKGCYGLIVCNSDLAREEKLLKFPYNIFY
jgi:hypothetical protein